ncbi:MAG: hypothetical protein ACD_79C01009G0002 [uncultured bacterium]|nr:MAG: hypothetical protein ACD_79C01009G0002 [uncultured bacterium]
MSLNILIVDDSEIIRAVIVKTLNVAKVPFKQIFQASNGKEALEILDKEWIDLVFADINMPVMNGLEMIEKMNSHNLLKSIPVVVVSTEGSATRIEELTAKGIKAYIRKPFTPEQVRQVVDKIMENKNEQ